MQIKYEILERLSIQIISFQITLSDVYFRKVPKFFGNILFSNCITMQLNCNWPILL